jgi:ubiquinone/menaquinone biosynthesis C-methylase UbiE
MKKSLISTLNLLLIITACFAQPTGTGRQKEEKIKKLKFCGYRFKDTALLSNNYREQLAFLNIKNGDTIVDVGTSSGAYIGALNTIGLFKNVHFILVDIDTNCLNRAKVNNMISYYEALHGSPFMNTFSLVNNTPDSLNLPYHRYKKIWLMNTLHEIPDKTAMALQLLAILQSGGELIIAEIPPTGKRTIHSGCNKPLMSEEEIKTVFTANGFSFSAMENLQPVAKHKNKHPLYFYRFIKM